MMMMLMATVAESTSSRPAEGGRPDGRPPGRGSEPPPLGWSGCHANMEVMSNGGGCVVVIIITVINILNMALEQSTKSLTPGLQAGDAGTAPWPHVVTLLSTPLMMYATLTSPFEGTDRQRPALPGLEGQ
jgi:hypothetical protein